MHDCYFRLKHPINYTNHAKILFVYCRHSYLESERKVLVLDTSVVDVLDSSRLLSSTTMTSPTSCLSVVIICPTVKHLNSLRRECGVGQLRDDLEQRLLTPDLIDELNAEIDAVRLDVQLNVDDMDLAQSEFQ